MPLRPCLDCPRLTTRADSRCPDCASRRGQARDARRGTRQARGYDAEHDALREQWRSKVECGGVHCARCQRLILPTEVWHLDHSDDRSGYLGPSCASCNLSAAGKAARR